MNEPNRTADIIVIGAGIAGASVAYELAHRGMSVCIVEMEAHPGYHTTGRSAATFVGCYGNEVIRAISAASRSFFDTPPPGFCDHPLLADRGALYVAGEAQLGDLDEFVAESSNLGLLERIDPLAVLEMVPVLNAEAVAGAAYERDAQDIDAFLRPNQGIILPSPPASGWAQKRCLTGQKYGNILCDVWVLSCFFNIF